MSKFVPAIFSAAILLSPAVALAGPAASQFSVAVYVTPTYIQAHTRIGATCVASVLYDHDQQETALGAPQHAGASGVVRWNWQQRAGSSAGTASVACMWKGQLQIGQVRFAAHHPSPPTHTPANPSPAMATSSAAPGVTVVASNLHADTAGDLAPPSGQQYAVLRLTIVNQGAQNYDYNPLNFFLEDASDHVQHPGDAMDTNIENSALQAGTLAPGQQITGDIAFQVPASETRFTLWWQPAFDAPKVPVPFK